MTQTRLSGTRLANHSTSNKSFRRPRWLIVAANLRHNLAARWNIRRGRMESDIGATHARLSTAESVAYINRVYEDYRNYGGLLEQAIRGKRILEVGPGDNLGVALRLYAAGAAQVVCLDKFFARRDEAQQLAVYGALRDTLSAPERARFDAALSLEGSSPRFNADCVRYLYGSSAEDAVEALGADTFDFVVSRAVIWEIHETDRALDALTTVLRKGGRMVHKIACIDWMFRDHGHHPLEFLTVPDRLYRWIAHDSGKSNRRSIAWYREKLATLGLQTRFHIVRTVGSTRPEFAPGTFQLKRGVHYEEADLEMLREIRPRLLPRFQTLTDEDLLVEDMFVVADKPQAAADIAVRTALSA
jgi:SAM-dependent methyltransferase